jgi:hypothetical protein
MLIVVVRIMNGMNNGVGGLTPPIVLPSLFASLSRFTAFRSKYALKNQKTQFATIVHYKPLIDQCKAPNRLRPKIMISLYTSLIQSKTK